MKKESCLADSEAPLSSPGKYYGARYKAATVLIFSCWRYPGPCELLQLVVVFFVGKGSRKREPCKDSVC